MSCQDNGCQAENTEMSLKSIANERDLVERESCQRFDDPKQTKYMNISKLCYVRFVGVFNKLTTV